MKDTEIQIGYLKKVQTGRPPRTMFTPTDGLVSLVMANATIDTYFSLQKSSLRTDILETRNALVRTAYATKGLLTLGGAIHEEGEIETKIDSLDFVYGDQSDPKFDPDIHTYIPGYNPNSVINNVRAKYLQETAFSGMFQPRLLGDKPDAIISLISPAAAGRLNYSNGQLNFEGTNPNITLFLLHALGNTYSHFLKISQTSRPVITPKDAARIALMDEVASLRG